MARLTRDQRHHQLLDVAEWLFIEHSFSQVSMEDIAREAGVTRAVVYQHYGSKEGVLLAAVNRARDDFWQQVEDAIATAADLDAFIRVVGELLFAAAEDRPERWMLLFPGTIGGAQGVAREIGKLKLESLEHVAAALRALIPELRDRELMPTLLAGVGVAEQLGRWYEHEEHVSRAFVTEQFCVLVGALARELYAPAVLTPAE